MSADRKVRAVKGGTVITPNGALEADLVMSGEMIVAIEERRAGCEAAFGEGRVLDASGCLVLPGGVDPHCHLMEEVRGATSAAALGGTTTVLSFTNPAGLRRRSREPLEMLHAGRS